MTTPYKYSTYYHKGRTETLPAHPISPLLLSWLMLTGMASYGGNCPELI